MATKTSAVIGLAVVGVVLAAVLVRRRRRRRRRLPDPSPRAELAPAGTHGTTELIRPAHIAEGVVFGPLLHCAGKTEVAVHDYKFWGGAGQPWRHGLDDTPVTDQGVIASEEQHKLTAEAEDQPTAGTPAHAEKLRGCGVRVDFLLALTFALEMWEWRTWQVVQYLVKPMTEGEERCRFAELAGVQKYAGAATVFMSHCWGGQWGDLVAAACTGADANRVVWIDVFAVRQWPGNGADLDFRGVLQGCTAAIVAAAPIEGTLLNGADYNGKKGMNNFEAREAFLKSDEYAAVAKVVPFCRLWCVVEMAAVLGLGKPLIFSCGKVVVADAGGGAEGGGAGRVEVVRGDEAFYMLTNCAQLVDVAASQCAVSADKQRELAAIGPASFGQINRTVAAALSTGAHASMAKVFEVDAFNCGEDGPLKALDEERFWDVFMAACSAGQLAVLVALWAAQAELVVAYLAGGDEKRAWVPVWAASMAGRVEVVEWLVGEVGAAAGPVHPRDGTSALCVAAQNGHLEVVRHLVAAGASVDQAKGNGVTPLYKAASKGHLGVVRALVAAGASVDQAEETGVTPLFIAAQLGHLQVVRNLLEARAAVNQASEDGTTPLWVASQNGHVGIVEALVEAGASLDQAPGHGATPLLVSVQNGHRESVRVLIKAGAALDQAKENGVTPLFRAAQDGHLESVSMLIKASAAVDQAREDGATPLYMAAWCGHSEVVRALEEAGAAVDQAKDDGTTPLFVAAQLGHLEVLRNLVKEGADLSVCMEGNGWSPLFVAAWGGHAAVVAELLQHGADRSTATAQEHAEIPAGSTALSVAQLKGHHGVVGLLS